MNDKNRDEWREMIASCPQCAMSLSFDDDRLPTEPFNVLCPRCRQSVTIMPPPKEEPRLPGTAGVLDAVATGSQAEKDPIAALAELLLSNLKVTQPQSSDANKWQRRRVLLCLDDAASRERLRSALDPACYGIFQQTSLRKR